jgi:hypothetical protein
MRSLTVMQTDAPVTLPHTATVWRLASTEDPCLAGLDATI